METLRLKVSFSGLLHRRSSLFHKLRLEAHSAKSINLARDVVLAVNDANVFDLGTRFHRFGSSFDRQIFDHHDGITIDQDLAISSSLKIYQGIIVTADNLFCVHPYSN